MENFNRYAVVYHAQYYPAGFEHDVQGRFINLEDAKTFLDKFVKDEYIDKDEFTSLYIFDLYEWKKVYVYVEYEV